jgi:Uma2 family endonuclease
MPDDVRRGMMLDRDAYYRWAEAQPRGRFERVNGEVLQMSPERWFHVRLKFQIWRFLEDALAGLPAFHAVGDGLAVQVADHTDFQPDAAVHCGDTIPGDLVYIPNPIVVIEVLSPSTQLRDTTTKVVAYMSVPSIAHYLIFHADRREVTLISRDPEARQHYREGAFIRLDPPGIMLDVDAIYGRAEAS